LGIPGTGIPGQIPGNSGDSVSISGIPETVYVFKIPVKALLLPLSDQFGDDFIDIPAVADGINNKSFGPVVDLINAPEAFDFKGSETGELILQGFAQVGRFIKLL